MIQYLLWDTPVLWLVSVQMKILRFMCSLLVMGPHWGVVASGARSVNID
jgi:hypothetical protein